MNIIINIEVKKRDTDELILRDSHYSVGCLEEDIYKIERAVEKAEKKEFEMEQSLSAETLGK